jgi:hypothetical protein
MAPNISKELAKPSSHAQGASVDWEQQPPRLSRLHPRGPRAIVRSTPVGDNYDFSSFQEVLGVVCTPFAVYTSTSKSLEFVAHGLRACASAAELDRWLSPAE